MNCTGNCNQGRRLCVTPHACGLITENSDGSDPHAETRDLIDTALAYLLWLIPAGVLIFVLFAAFGFWSAR